MSTRKALLAAGLILGGALPSAQADDQRDWGQKLSPPMRYEILVAFNNDAVLDKETQVVWQAAPSQEAMTWSEARTHCRLAMTAGRMGWRLPNLHELSAIFDPVGDEGAALFGGPFGLAGSPNMHWTATSVANDANSELSSSEYAYAVATYYRLGPANAAIKKATKLGAWCVRGQSATDSY